MTSRRRLHRAALPDQSELYGPIAADPTVWRTLDAIGQRERGC